MLAPHEIRAGSLADARPLSLMLQRNIKEKTFLVGGSQEEPSAVFISEGDHSIYKSFKCKSNTIWRGALVDDVSIEIDETTLFDPGTVNAPAGSLIRKLDMLGMSVIVERWNGFDNFLPLARGLPSLPEREEVGFYRWQVIIGVGLEKRVLRKIDVLPQSLYTG